MATKYQLYFEFNHYSRDSWVRKYTTLNVDDIGKKNNMNSNTRYVVTVIIHTAAYKGECETGVPVRIECPTTRQTFPSSPIHPGHHLHKYAHV